VKFLDVQKKRLKKRIYKAVNLSAAHSSHDARLAWQIVLKFLFSRRRYLVGLTIVSALAAIFEGATMAALGLAVSLFVDKGVPEISGLPDSIAIQFGELLRDGAREKIFIIIVSGAVAAQVLKSILLYFSEWIQIHLGFALRIHLQQLITRHIMGLSFHDISQFPAGKLATYIDQSKLVLDITVQFGSIIRAVMMAAAYGAVMISMSIHLTLATIIILLVLWVSLKTIVRRLQALAKETTMGEIALWRWTVEFLNAPKLLRMINGTDRATSEIDNAWLSFLTPERRSDLISAAIPKALETVTVLIAGIFLVGAVMIVPENRESLISSLFVYVLIFFRLRPVIKAFNELRIKIARIIPRLDVVGQLLKIQLPSMPDGEAVRLRKFRKSLRFENVTFHYPGAQKNVLSKINLEICRGSTTALVGRSGSGKTTIADLILGLYQPTKGKILVDGSDLQTLHISEWRKLIGVVDQENFLLNASILENIRFGRSEIEMSGVEAAAKAAHADEFIGQLEKKYDTVIGDRGLKLSGGQQQRLALARALVANPSILIMDEATSALDSVSEKMIQRTIDEIRHERTIIVIAHRLSTVMSADNIIVIEDGVLVEQGTREELMQHDSYFTRLWNAQTN